MRGCDVWTKIQLVEKSFMGSWYVGYVYVPERHPMYNEAEGNVSNDSRFIGFGEYELSWSEKMVDDSGKRWLKLGFSLMDESTDALKTSYQFAEMIAEYGKAQVELYEAEFLLQESTVRLLAMEEDFKQSTESDKRLEIIWNEWLSDEDREKLRKQFKDE